MRTGASAGILLAAGLVVLPHPARAESGLASWYTDSRVACPGMHAGPGFAAHKTLPCRAKIRINGQFSVIISDRGPFNSRIIDLHPEDFKRLAPLSQGVVKVTIEKE